MNQNTFTYRGVGACGKCNQPEWLWSCNNDHIAQLTDNAYGNRMCRTCWFDFSFIRWLESDTDATELNDRLDELVGINPDTEVPVCDYCFLPEVINAGMGMAISRSYASILGGESDRNPITGMSHTYCARMVCDGCTNRFVTRTGFGGFQRGLPRQRYNHGIEGYASPFFTGGTILDPMYRIVGGEEYCRACYENYVRDEGYELDDFTKCVQCGGYSHQDDFINNWGDPYCESCNDEYISFCDECDEIYHRDNRDDHDHDNEDDDEYDSPYNGVIHNYSYKPAPQFFGKDKFHMGFELEVEARGNTNRYQGAEIAQEALQHHAYMKDDGSLNDGFEIVTHPHTLSVYQNEFSWEFIPKLVQSGFRSWNAGTCGIHVHISRSGFGVLGDRNPITGRMQYSVDRANRILARQAHELRFIKLIYDNSRQVQRLAGRSTHFASFSDKGNLVTKVKQGYQSDGHYSAVNTENGDTIEVRVFKGSLKKERVLSALEFCHAATEYTRNLKVSSTNNALSWLKFCAYVAENDKVYPNLATIINRTFQNETIDDSE